MNEDRANEPEPGAVFPSGLTAYYGKTESSELLKEIAKAGQLFPNITPTRTDEGLTIAFDMWWVKVDLGYLSYQTSISMEKLVDSSGSPVIVVVGSGSAVPADHRAHRAGSVSVTAEAVAPGSGPRPARVALPDSN